MRVTLFDARDRDFITKVDMDYSDELNKRDYDYPLAPELMTFDAKLTGEKEIELRAACFNGAAPSTAS